MSTKGAEKAFITKFMISKLERLMIKGVLIYEKKVTMQLSKLMMVLY